MLLHFYAFEQYFRIFVIKTLAGILVNFLTLYLIFVKRAPHISVGVAYHILHPSRVFVNILLKKLRLLLKSMSLDMYCWVLVLTTSQPWWLCFFNLKVLLISMFLALDYLKSEVSVQCWQWDWTASLNALVIRQCLVLLISDICTGQMQAQKMVLNHHFSFLFKSMYEVCKMDKGKSILEIKA